MPLTLTKGVHSMISQLRLTFLVVIFSGLSIHAVSVLLSTSSLKAI
jgi:hypothetical protein